MFLTTFVFYITLFSLLVFVFTWFFPHFVSVLVALYEQADRPNNALEYPFKHIKLFLTLPNNCVVGRESGVCLHPLLLHNNILKKREKCEK